MNGARGAYASEFVEKTVADEYGHRDTNVPYTGRGSFSPRPCPPSGTLWDRAAAAGVTYRSYGEFITVGPARLPIPG